MVPDREEDMKPRFHRGKVAGGEVRIDFLVMMIDQ